MSAIDRKKPTQRRLVNIQAVEALWDTVLTVEEKNWLWSFTQTERKLGVLNWNDLTEHQKLEMGLALMVEL